MHVNQSWPMTRSSLLALDWPSGPQQILRDRIHARMPTPSIITGHLYMDLEIEKLKTKTVVATNSTKFRTNLQQINHLEIWKFENPIFEAWSAFKKNSGNELSKLDLGITVSVVLLSEYERKFRRIRYGSIRGYQT